MKKLILFYFVMLVLLTGCNEEKKFIPKSKKYYVNNLQIAKKRLIECKKLGMGTEAIRIDCTNANLAINEKISKSNRPIFRDEKKVTDW